jgi:3'-phosphoadenosine 5'-phosphosulfate sulfotransferase (PAPS reductase)/FAD synthetase
VSVVHIVNVSGGKDSDCCYLLALERGRPFRAVFADTGNEHPATYDHVAQLASRTGGPEVEVIKRDFTADIARRRERLPVQWAAVGVPQALIDDALSILHPTGVPYLDMVLAKGMFASGVSTKFCTEYLKILPTDAQVFKPLLTAGTSVVQWLGVRRDESKKRAEARKIESSRAPSRDGRPTPRLITWRPIVTWTVEDVIAFHDRHGLPMNPLYAVGFSRVGCFPCVNERKAGMALIAAKYPEHIDRIREWEALVSRAQVARKNLDYDGKPSTFFPRGTVGKGRDNPIDEVVRWSKTARGGRQFDLFAGETGRGLIACDVEGWCES